MENRFRRRRVEVSQFRPETEKRILEILPAPPALWNAEHIPLG